ncbi:biotin/lipoyl-containing protein [Cryptosporangium aurantiacum]|uniref:Biotin-requiring enzyme n=1 Tax=Cryptosporangium aurantiacum TaxID=134849 RepID=A0A1M7KG59_9ACTN|nr:biotin/lipoyl-containing protein [Cryptosporangium aurantiacum]SHM64214.1 Biotin-requiring enzyme [Cryptosporangium aurantiacum]
MTQKVPVQVPKLTMATTEVTFLEWLVEDGQTVEEEQPLYVVATDKVENEVAAPASGILRHGTAEPEEVYPVGTEIATIEVA